jgi:hypothetical protein
MRGARGLVVAVVGAAALALAAVGSAATAYDVKLTGTEVPPITSTLGTFVGVANGELKGTWRVQIVHEPLKAGTTSRITGGGYSLVTASRRKVVGRATSGSVTPVNPGAGCTNQTFRVVTTFSNASFDGTLVHHRQKVLGRCVIYAATISGRGTFRF